jgi:hypothetical protein
MAATAEIQTRILARCAAVDVSRSHRDVRMGLYSATRAVHDTPLAGSPREWLEAVLAAIAAVRERFVDPADDDGWALGGVATIRNLVEDELEALGAP